MSRIGKVVDEQAIANKYRAGRSQQSLGREFGINAQRIAEILKAQGVKPRKPGRPRGVNPAAAENKGREDVYARSQGWCELQIRVCTGRGEEWQHRKNRSQGGTWDPANGLHVCSACHRYIHQHPTEAAEKGWTVKESGDPRTTPVWIRGVRVLINAVGGSVLAPDSASSVAS
jgi:hypothetical protein